MKRILLIEDEWPLASVIGTALTEAGYSVDFAYSGDQGMEMFQSNKIDLVLLNVMLPDFDGFEVLKRLRRVSQAPVMMLTARGSLDDRVAGLDGGADDYIVKPFRVRELLARIRALARRTVQIRPIDCGPLSIDPVTRKATLAGKEIYLSTTELSLLEFLASRQGNVISRTEILQRIWQDADRESNVVEVYISYLRQKLDRPGVSRLLHTVRGKGYVLSEEEPN